jgi:septal ring factor EnvC (AmiA/AmiB activator)
MADIPDQIRALQVRVSKLETWAGPGQADALTASVRALRADVADIRRVQRQHTGLLGALNRDVAGLKRVQDEQTALLGGLDQDVAGLKQEVAGLKGDMAEVKAALAEILRRLPPLAG